MKNMEIITTTAMFVLGSFLTKVGGGIATEIGKDIWAKVKTIFAPEKKQELEEKISEGRIEELDLKEIENALTEQLKAPAFRDDLKKRLHITPANEFILKQNLDAYTKIKNNLKECSEGYTNAGIATTGDYYSMMKLNEGKLKKIEQKIMDIINKQ
jgi:hypothetical protein